MQTQPAAKRRTPSKPRPRALPYPTLPEGDCHTNRQYREYWWASWQRDLAQLDALETHGRAIKYWALSDPLADAIAGAINNCERDLRDSFHHLLSFGGLLLAWAPEGGAA